MATDKKTPSIGARGRYVLVAPWAANASKLYTCIAVRTFNDIYVLGQDVQKMYYIPMGLTDGAIVGGQPFTFAAEALKKPNIVSLQSDDGQTIYVPDTFIASFPSQGDVKYSHIVLSVSIGPQPDYLDLSEVQDAISQTVSQRFGFTPTVKVHKAPSTDNPTAQQHEAIQAARKGTLALLETDAAKAVRLANEKIKQQLTIHTLTNMLRANNIPPFNR